MCGWGGLRSQDVSVARGKGLGPFLHKNDSLQGRTERKRRTLPAAKGQGA